MNLKENKWLLIVLTFLCIVCVNAQRKQAVTAKKQMAEVNYSATVEINKDSKTKIFIESDTWNSVENVFSVLNQKIASKKLKLNQIIIKPDPIVKFEQIDNVIKQIRKSATQNIVVKISDDFFAVTSKPLKKNVIPNPLTLIVNLDETGKIFLNSQEEGTINDLTQLKNLLKQIFKERTDNGVFREGTNEVETAAFINIPDSNHFSDFIKIAQTLRESGVTPIGIQTDEFIRTLQMRGPVELLK